MSLSGPDALGWVHSGGGMPAWGHTGGRAVRQQLPRPVGLVLSALTGAKEAFFSLPSQSFLFLKISDFPYKIRTCSLKKWKVEAPRWLN